jgi:hypothetical protein
LTHLLMYVYLFVCVSVVQQRRLGNLVSFVNQIPKILC